MEGRRRFGRTVVVSLLLFLQNLSLCWSLNDEEGNGTFAVKGVYNMFAGHAGLALFKFREKVVTDPFGALSNWNKDCVENNPCSWFGVHCSAGKVVALILRDLCLEGTLAPELGELVHLKSITLRNNSFYGKIPKEIGELKGLEVLDLGYNNFSGSSSSAFSHNLSLTTL
ncbi:LRR domain containing protein [Parasponia andersonii]|uniref:LRR domain containing protein n=1 Tax=Parasponia andersonii TaxID=3476 RepID=A0A2P5AFX7_PARAD|nr:LRR domain containing protein [Parasponia andersonii]